MKATIKTIAALATLAFATPAIAGGVSVFDDGESKLKIGGKVFADVTSYKATDGAGATTAKINAARIERAYLTAKYSFNKDWMMRITTDVTLAKDLNAGGKNNNIFLKYAYLEGKLIGKAAVLRLGQSHTPWIDYEQGLWKHRYMSKVMTDTFKYDASSDVGIGLKGELADGMVGYWATLTNGAGYSHIDRTGNKMDFNSRIGFYPIEGLTLDFQYRTGYLGKNQFNAAAAKNTLYQVMATYGMGKDFRIGANYAANDVSPVGGGAKIKNKMYGVWGWAKIAGDFGAFGRFESNKDNAAAATKKKDDHYSVGVEYFPVKGVTLALGYDATKSTLGGASNGKTSRIGLWSETKF